MKLLHAVSVGPSDNAVPGEPRDKFDRNACLEDEPFFPVVSRAGSFGPRGGRG